jgi:hypothetical protein
MMGVQELLQNALVGANNERIAGHGTVQMYDRQILELKAALEKAQSTKAAMAAVRDVADKNYRELLDYSNSRTEQSERDALSPDIERLAQEVTAATIRVRPADEAVRQAQRRLTDFERDRAVAQMNLKTATERWEQIRKQLDEAQHHP